MKVEAVEASYEFDITYPVVIVGAGACGMSAALAASDEGLDVLLLEQDKSPLGTTAMSTGLIPAAGTAEQQESGIDDSAIIFAGDIMRKAKNVPNPEVVQALAETSAETITWLRDQHQVPLSLVSGFTYPGHSVQRMYGSPNRSGGELMAALQSAVEKSSVDLLTEAQVEDLLINDNSEIVGVRILRPDGNAEVIGCETLILACCGFAGNAEMVGTYIPEMKNATFHGHPGNKGHAVFWGESLGAQLSDMGSYQGHGGLAYGYAIPILWPLIMEGGIQVNCDGFRFSNESQGYSEQAVKVIEQPGSIAWSVFDQRLYDLMMDFDDFQEAVSAGAVLKAEDISELATRIKVPEDNLKQTMNEISVSSEEGDADQFGRHFQGLPALQPPLYAAKITGALFHTQGGLEVNGDARVLRSDGRPFANLFAGGGAARGVSGDSASGYIAGNGLLTATGLGKIAGRLAAHQVKS